MIEAKEAGGGDRGIKKPESIGEIDSIVMKDVAKFLYSIKSDAVYPVKLYERGLKIDFINPYEIQGNVEINREAWKSYCNGHNEELGFDVARIRKMFATMKKGEIAEIKLNSNKMIVVWHNLHLVWTHLLIEPEDRTENYLLPENLNYPVVLSLIGQPILKSIEKGLKIAKKELERWESWEGVIIQYKERIFKIFIYRFEYGNINGAWTFIPEIKQILELSEFQFDLHKGEAETIGIYSLKNFEHIIKSAKSGNLTLSFGNEMPLKTVFELRRGISVVAYQIPADLAENEKEKLINCINN